MEPTTYDRALADLAVLALVAEGDAHGWAVVRAMAPAGEVGRVWSCSRARVYRALDVLAAAALIETARVVRGGQGPARRMVAATPAGRRAVAAWLHEPVHHVRDLRSAFLLKLLFLQRAGGDPSSLLGAQRRALEPMVERFSGQVGASDGFERTLALWRLESSRAALGFVDALLAHPAAATTAAR